MVVGGDAVDGGFDPAEKLRARSIAGLFLFRGKFGGIHSRCGYEGPAGYWDHRMDMGTLVVSDSRGAPDDGDQQARARAHRAALE